MTTKERTFNSLLRGMLPGDYMRVENGVMDGVPDINVCYQGTEVWIESKVFVNGVVYIRPFQSAWMTRRSKNGGNVYVVAFNEEDDHVYVWRAPVFVVVKGKYVTPAEPARWKWHRKDFTHYCHVLFE